MKGDPMTIEFVGFERPMTWASVGHSSRLVATSQGPLRHLMPMLGPVMRQREDRNLGAIKAALEREDRGNLKLAS